MNRVREHEARQIKVEALRQNRLDVRTGLVRRRSQTAFEPREALEDRGHGTTRMRDDVPDIGKSIDRARGEEIEEHPGFIEHVLGQTLRQRRHR